MKTLTYKYEKPFKLEKGGTLPELELAYTTLGNLNADKSNVVWITHALTANADASDWWSGLVGLGKLYNPQEHFIVCVNVPGSHYGSTGPLSKNPDTGSPYYRNFPELSIRDIVRGLDLLREKLGISKIQTLIGGSIGGQQAIEWAIQQPEVFDNLVLLATNAKHSPWGVAFNESQRLAIQADRTFYANDANGGLKGLKAARSIALLSYRSGEAYNSTQPSDNNLDDQPASTYQRYQGDKLVNRFNAYSYWYLSKTMDSHDVGRDRGGIANALQQVVAKTLVIAITEDILFPPADSQELAKHIPNAQYAEISSKFGHDGFLIESKQIEEQIINFTTGRPSTGSGQPVFKNDGDIEKLLSYEFLN